MDCPKAEVLILNFSSNEYFLSPFLDDMPKLRALILINYSTSNIVFHNLSVFHNLNNLRSLWFEKIYVPQIFDTTIPLKNLQRVSLILCDIDTGLDQSAIDLPRIFPRSSELAIDHCINLNKLPSSICRMHTLKILNVTNCDSLQELPADLGKINFLQLLRLYSCLNLKRLPVSIGHLVWLKYLDISQCVTMGCLLEGVYGARATDEGAGVWGFWAEGTCLGIGWSRF
ncbi:putative disease resistance protein [Forsythia ovata]|uniref:Disease resistance protein n=1 Tax=Forsythia ovata TaxID=205694 RepID=A0ABD1X1L3_9LAMI